MAKQSKPALDRTDVRILAELQRDGRASHAELGRRVHLSATAVARRMERMERDGVIRGYRVDINPAALAAEGIDAIIRFRARLGRLEDALAAIRVEPAVRECLQVTGEDCFVVRATVGSMRELGAFTEALQRYGATETALVLATPVERQPLPLTANATWTSH